MNPQTPMQLFVPYETKGVVRVHGPMRDYRDRGVYPLLLIIDISP